MTNTCIGCDDGYAAIKLAWFTPDMKIETLAIPSRAQPGLSMSNLDGDVQNAYESCGERFTVGSRVKPADTRFKDYPVSALNRALIHHSLKIAGMGGRDISLATGLPYEQFVRDKQNGSKLINAKRDSLTKPVTSIAGETLANIKKSLVFGEATSALIDYIIAEDGSERFEGGLQGAVGIVDIGGRTTDCVCVIEGGKNLDQSRSGTEQVGVLDVVSKMSESICEALDLDDLGSYDTDEILQTRTIKVFGKPQDVSAHVDAAIHEVGMQVISLVQARFGQAADMDAVLFVGGGAELMKSVVKQYPNAHVPEHPQFANARGMLKYMLLLEQE